MTTYDVLIRCDNEKAKALYDFLKSVKCEDLLGSNLVLACRNLKPASYAYRVMRNSNNTKYAYLYSIVEFEVRTPVELDRFMERTVKI